MAACALVVSGGSGGIIGVDPLLHQTEKEENLGPASSWHLTRKPDRLDTAMQHVSVAKGTLSRSTYMQVHKPIEHLY